MKRLIFLLISTLTFSTLNDTTLRRESTPSIEITDVDKEIQEELDRQKAVDDEIDAIYRKNLNSIEEDRKRLEEEYQKLKGR